MKSFSDWTQEIAEQINKPKEMTVEELHEYLQKQLYDMINTDPSKLPLTRKYLAIKYDDRIWEEYGKWWYVCERCDQIDELPCGPEEVTDKTELMCGGSPVCCP